MIVVVTEALGVKPVPLTVTVPLPPVTEIEAVDVALVDELVVFVVLVVVFAEAVVLVDAVVVDGAGDTELTVVLPCGIVVWSSAAFAVLIMSSKLPCAVQCINDSLGDSCSM